MAALAEERKKNIYAHLDPSHSFTPVAVETSDVVGPQSLAFLKDLGHRMRQVTGEERSLSYLLQRVSVAVQRAMLPQCWARLDCLSRKLTSFLSSFFCFVLFCLFSPCLFTCTVVLVFLCLFSFTSSFSLV